MSRDLTPKELDQLQKMYNLPNIVETMKVSIGDLEQDVYCLERDMYNEEQKILVRTYPRLGMFGFYFLELCRCVGILSNERGLNLIQEIENYFANGENMSDPILQDKVIAWYEGKLCSGYYMAQNTEELVHIIIQQLNLQE